MQQYTSTARQLSNPNTPVTIPVCAVMTLCQIAVATPLHSTALLSSFHTPRTMLTVRDALDIRLEHAISPPHYSTALVSLRPLV